MMLTHNVELEVMKPGWLEALRLPSDCRERDVFWQQQLDALRQSHTEAQSEAQNLQQQLEQQQQQLAQQHDELLQQQQQAAAAAEDAVAAAVADRDAAWQHSQEQAAAAAAAERDSVWQREVHAAQQAQQPLQAQVTDTRSAILRF